MGTQWPGMGKHLMAIDTFKKSIMKSHAVLKRHGIDLYDLIMNGTSETFKDVLNSFVCLTSIQVKSMHLFCGTNIQHIVVSNFLISP